MEPSDIVQCAGRCDICGKPIDMSSGDVMISEEFGMFEADVEFDIDDQAAIDAVADAMERVADSGAGYDLAETIRNDGEFNAHERCVNDTNFDQLEH